MPMSSPISHQTCWDKFSLSCSDLFFDLVTGTSEILSLSHDKWYKEGVRFSSEWKIMIQKQGTSFIHPCLGEVAKNSVE